MNIKLLDPSVYNQISAGEVVENPASVVKELVENCIDAGATEISVFIEDGGIKSIQVIDNGQGIAEDELKLAVMPHATSKLFTAEDLSMISTLGFRGEALASIASVSTVEIKSIRQGAETGAKLLIKGGEILEKGIAPLDKGTNISVKGLFFNTPARYKFLKSKRAEEVNVTKLISELILSNPDISIKYYIDNKIQFSSAGDGLLSAVESIYGAALADDLLEINTAEGAFILRGYIGKPASKAIKSNRNNQTLIINGRLVSDARVSAAIQNAYGEALMKKTFPIYILDLVMPFGGVDINVHPSKREVRFANSNKVCGIFYHAVKEALRLYYENSHISLSRRETPFKSDISDKSITQTEIKHNTLADKYINDYTPVHDLARNLLASMHSDSPLGSAKKAVFKEPSESYASFYYGKRPMGKKETISPLTDDKISSEQDAGIRINSLDFGRDETNGTAASDSSDSKDFNSFEVQNTNLKGNDFTQYKIVGQIFDTYIIVETEEELLIIDQHAAHERIIYDSFMRELESGEITVQEMLVPHIYEVEGSPDYILRNLENLKEMGFYIEEFGNNFLKVNALPLQFVNIDINKFLDDINEEKVTRSLKDNTVIKDILAKSACKNAIKGGRNMDKGEIEFVIKHFLTDSMPFQCPHGRPVTIKITKREIEKMFRRIV